MSINNILELDDFNWEKIIGKGKKSAVVMFSSPTCPFCKQIEPYFKENAEEFKNRIIFAEVDISRRITIARRYGVMGTPAFKFFCKGCPVHEIVGAVYPSLFKKAVEEFLEHGAQCVDKTTWFETTNIGYV